MTSSPVWKPAGQVWAPAGPAGPAGPVSPLGPGGPAGPWGPGPPVGMLTVTVVVACWAVPRAGEVRKPEPAASPRAPAIVRMTSHRALLTAPPSSSRSPHGGPA